MKKQNKVQVRNGRLKFALAFLILCCFSFLIVSFFFKSFDFQNKKIKNDIIAYKQLLNKQQLLKQKLDGIYNNMSLVNSGMVENDVFLENYISKDIQDVKQIIGEDSISEFKHYAFLIANLDKLLKLKDTLVLIDNSENQSLRDLQQCTGQINKVKKELATDPTRGFTTR